MVPGLADLPEFVEPCLILRPHGVDSNKAPHLL
jgi:hypothetical protein